MSACSTKTAVLLDDVTSSVFVDDSNPSIVYSESWFPQGSGYNRPFSSDALPNGTQDPNYNHTVHLTSTNGETALFTFNGIGVQVVGSVGPEPWGGLPVSRYTLDTLPTFVYRASADDSTFKTNVTFFESPLLADGPHTLLITNEPCQNIPSSCKFMLDYIVWTNPNGSTSTSTTTSNPSATSTALCVAETDRGAASQHSRGMIIGPVIGGIILLVLFALWLLRFTRKRRQSKGVAVVDMIEDRHDLPTHEESDTRQTEMLLAQPYPLGPHSPSHSGSQLLAPTYADDSHDPFRSSNFTPSSSAGPSSATMSSQQQTTPVLYSSKGQMIRQQAGSAPYEDAPPAYSPTPSVAP